MAEDQKTRRVRIDSRGQPFFADQLEAADVGSLAHVSQLRWYYVDVMADNDEAAVSMLLEQLGHLGIGEDELAFVSSEAPLDDPGAMPPLGPPNA